MRLESLLALIEGKLLTAPSITAVHEIVVHPKRVMRGDLFVALDGDILAIQTALALGAYAIITDLDMAPLDTEVAWFYVTDVQRAHLQLLRFFLLPKQIEVFYTDTMTLNFLEMLGAQEWIIIHDSLLDWSQKLWHIKPHTKLLVKTQPHLHTLFPTALPLKTYPSPVEIEPYSAFESHLCIDNHTYKRQKLPFFLAPFFGQALGFMLACKLPWSLEHLTFPRGIHVQFYDRYFTPKEFGKGHKIIVYLEDETHLDAAYTHIKKMMPWARTYCHNTTKETNISYNYASLLDDYECVVLVGLAPILDAPSSKPMQLSLF